MCKGTRRRRAGTQVPCLRWGLEEAEILKRASLWPAVPRLRSQWPAELACRTYLPAAQQPRASRAKKGRHRCKLEKERASHYAAAPIKTENSALLGVSPSPCQEGAGSEKPQLHFFPYSSVMSFRGAFSLSQQNHLFSSFLPLPRPHPVCFLPFISHSPSFGLPHT